jgi:hypothetical protein
MVWKSATSVWTCFFAPRSGQTVNPRLDHCFRRTRTLDDCCHFVFRPTLLTAFSLITLRCQCILFYFASTTLLVLKLIFLALVPALVIREPALPNCVLFMPGSRRVCGSSRHFVQLSRLTTFLRSVLSYVLTSVWSLVIIKASSFSVPTNVVNNEMRYT